MSQLNKYRSIYRAIKTGKPCSKINNNEFDYSLPHPCQKMYAVSVREASFFNNGNDLTWGSFVNGRTGVSLRMIAVQKIREIK